MAKKKAEPEKLTAEESDWLKETGAVVADNRLDLEDIDRQIQGHHDEIASHRQHIKLLRKQQRIAQKRLVKGMRAVARFKMRKGLPA